MTGKVSVVAATAVNITSMYAIVQFNGAGQKSKCLRISSPTERNEYPVLSGFIS